jgi:transposase-like protein
MGHAKAERDRNRLLPKRWFADEVIILCVRWYLRFRLSFRDLASIAAEMGIAVSPSTILRWVVRYTREFVSRWARFEMIAGRSWRADETYIKVNGGWVYLYRAVDEKGRTVASYLSRTRDQTAARTFFRQALKRHGEPRSITLDGFEPSHTALRRMGMRNEFNHRWANPVKIWAGPEFPWTGCWEKLMKENSHVYIEETRFRSCGRSRKGD